MCDWMMIMSVGKLDVREKNDFLTNEKVGHLPDGLTNHVSNY